MYWLEWEKYRDKIHRVWHLENNSLVILKITLDYILYWIIKFFPKKKLQTINSADVETNPDASYTHEKSSPKCIDGEEEETSITILFIKYHLLAFLLAIILNRRILTLNIIQFTPSQTITIIVHDFHRTIILNFQHKTNSNIIVKIKPWMSPGY